MHEIFRNINAFTIVCPKILQDFLELKLDTECKQVFLNDSSLPKVFSL